MTNQEAMKLALEALVLNNKEWKSLADSGDAGFWSAEEQDHYKQAEEAIKALEEALKQEGQSNFCPQCEALARELKASKQEQGEPKHEDYLSKAYRLANELRCHLAIAPAPQQGTWVGLTVEEIDNITAQKLKWQVLDLCLAIEAKLKEKNT